MKSREPHNRRIGLIPAICLTVIAFATPLRPALASDCYPDRVASYVPGFVSAPPAFNSWQPGIVLGPPGDAAPTSGSLTVLSLGHGGTIVLEFSDNVIVDRPGPDFIVFENPFFCTQAPVTADDPYSVLAEPGIVAASEDGTTFHTFPFDSAALAEVVDLCTDRELLARLDGLMGLTPNFTGNFTIPNDPLVFDPGAPGGISGHGGDAFDLADIGLVRARFIRITDPDLPIGIPGAGDGLDLDTVIALNAEAILPAGREDRDGDGLADADEVALYGTNPDDPDSDGDGRSDGEEVAGCRNPLSASTEPFFLPRVDLEIAVPVPTSLRWSTAGPGRTYDLIRGSVGTLRTVGGMVDLGVVACVEPGSTDLTNRFFEDDLQPPEGGAFFYLVRVVPDEAGLGYGHSTIFEPRVAASGDCP